MIREESRFIQVINREFERTIPIIHKEGRNNYVLIQKTKSGLVRIMARVTSETIARRIVNDFIQKMNDQQPKARSYSR